MELMLSPALHPEKVDKKSVKFLFLIPFKKPLKRRPQMPVLFLSRHLLREMLLLNLLTREWTWWFVSLKVFQLLIW